MAKETKRYGSVKRFGVRYGTKLKGKIAKIESERHLSTKCPHCHYNHVKRLAVGIWYCSKCKNKFTGKAYTIGKPAGIQAEEKPAQVQAAEEDAAKAAENFGEEENSMEEAEQASSQDEEA